MLKNWLKTIAERMPVQNLILFESKPCLSDNTKPVFDEMQRRGYHKKYKLIWLVDEETDTRKLPKLPGVYYVKKSQRIRYHLVLYTAKCIVCCNEPLATANPGQTSIYISHGSPVKSVSGYYTLPDEIRYMINQCGEFNEEVSRQLHFPPERSFAIGYPRTDILLKARTDISRLFSADHQKVIAWYPTFRQHKKVGGLTECKNAIPIIHSDADAERLNAYAREKKVILVLKTHFAQDTERIHRIQRSNLVMVEDSFFEEMQISSYEFLASCDALLTDYSSVYYDFTLLDKPIGLIWEDIEEFRKNPGFCIDLERYMRGGEKLYNMEQLMHFIDEVAMGQDPLRAERNEIRAIVDEYKDGTAARRVTDFIAEHAGLL